MADFLNPDDDEREIDFSGYARGPAPPNLFELLWGDTPAASEPIYDLREIRIVRRGSFSLSDMCPMCQVKLAAALGMIPRRQG